MSVIDDYLSEVPEPQRTTLSKLRDTLRALLPNAEEAISYGMPAFKIDGKAVAGFAATKKHCAYYPHSSTVISALNDVTVRYDCAKGTVRFPIDKPLPKKIVKALVDARRRELAG